MNTLKLHPALDNGVHLDAENLRAAHCSAFAQPKKFRSKMTAKPCTITRLAAANGWKPEGAKFAVIAVVSRGSVSLTANSAKLVIVDEGATIQRHTCKAYSAHLYGQMENQNHAFYRLDFVYTELSPNWMGRSCVRSICLINI